MGLYSDSCGQWWDFLIVLKADAKRPHALKSQNVYGTVWGNRNTFCGATSRSHPRSNATVMPVATSHATDRLPTCKQETFPDDIRRLAAWTLRLIRYRSRHWLCNTACSSS